MALLLAACESEKAPSFIKGNPYAKEFARLNGPVKSAVYSYYKKRKVRLLHPERLFHGRSPPEEQDPCEGRFHRHSLYL